MTIPSHKKLNRDNVLRLFIPLVSILIFCLWDMDRGLFKFSTNSFGFLILAWIAYAIAHFFRAVRLIVLAKPVLNVRLRTLFLLHFHTAIVILTMPFKLGELYRIRELGVIGDDYGRAFLVVVMERAFDAVVLITLCLELWLFQQDLPQAVRLTALVMAIVIITTLFIMIVVEPFLAQMQSYIFRYHVSKKARAILQIMDSLRHAIRLSLDCIRGQLPLILGLSTLIWSSEVATLISLASFMGGQTERMVISNAVRAILPGEGNMAQPYPLLALWFQFLCICWILSTPLYLTAVRIFQKLPHI